MNITIPVLAVKVRTALGLTRRTLDVDETATRVGMWDIRDLDAVFARVGGTVTAQPVQRPLSVGTTYTITEVTLTVTLSGIGEVQVFTDWDPAKETHGLALPVIRAIAQKPAAA